MILCCQFLENEAVAGADIAVLVCRRTSWASRGSGLKLDKITPTEAPRASFSLSRFKLEIFNHILALEITLINSKSGWQAVHHIQPPVTSWILNTSLQYHNCCTEYLLPATSLDHINPLKQWHSSSDQRSNVPFLPAWCRLCTRARNFLLKRDCSVRAAQHHST
jgi:hypothetical protein